MKGLLLSGVVFLLSLPVFADPGNCYCFRGSVQIQQKVINGYFQVYTYEEVNKDIVQGFVNHQKTFTQFVKTHTNGADSLHLYKDILVVDKTTPVLLTRLVSSPWQDIQAVTYQSVTSCAVGTSILTALSLNDKGWVTKQAFRRETMPESEACEYDIIYYVPKDKTITQLLEKLAKATKDQYGRGCTYRVGAEAKTGSGRFELQQLISLQNSILGMRKTSAFVSLHRTIEFVTIFYNLYPILL